MSDYSPSSRSDLSHSSFFRRHVVSISVALCGIVLVGAGASLGWQTFQSHGALRRAVAANDAADHLFLAVVELGRERGLGGIILGGGQPPGGMEAFRAVRNEAERHWAAGLDGASALSEAHERSGTVPRIIDEARQRAEHHRELRRRIDSGENPPSGLAWFDAVTERNVAVADLRDELLLSSEIPANALSPLLNSRRLACSAVENAGRVRGLLSYYAAAGRPVPPDRLQQIRAYRADAEAALRELLQRSEEWGLEARLRDESRRLRQGFLQELESRGERMLDAAADGRYPMGPEVWYELSTEVIDDAIRFTRAIAEQTLARAEARAARHRTQLMIYLLLAAGAGALALASLARVRQSANAAFLQRELAETTLKSIGDAVLTTDAEGRVDYLNPVAEVLTGWSNERARGRPASEVLRIRNRLHASMTDPVAACLDHGRIVGLTSGHLLVRPDGGERAIEDSVAPIRNAAGVVVGTVMVFYDADGRVRDDHLLSYHATHDPLTGLLNRREFERRLEELVYRARHFEEEHALLYLDLDQFKIINDLSGHAAGDRILGQVAMLLDKQLRKSDTLARLGGDEFGILLQNCDMNHARKRAGKLLEAIGDFRFASDGKTFEIGISIGLVPLQADSPGPVALLSEADSSCFLAKEKGRNRVEAAGADRSELERRRSQMEWAARLPELIDSDGFELFVQPFRTLTDDLPPREEILLRVPLHKKDPTGELILPMAFIPAAERYGLMPRLDRWVIEHTFRKLSLGHPADDTVMHINLSGATLDDSSLVSFIRERAADHGISPERICFEITETAAVAHLDKAIRIMEALRADGFTFALDDVGTGLSSFSYVKLLPAQVMKIAGAFVKRVEEDAVNRAMIECVSRLASLMDVETVAEQVESESTVDFLKQAGVHYAQGYAVAHPMPLQRYLEGRVDARLAGRS